MRVHRKLREKVLYDAILQCTKCGDRFVWDQWFLFLFGRKSRCPQCGSFGVEKLHEVDQIDGMYKNPISYLQKYFGAHLHWCRYCRLQFYDLRKRVPTGERSVGAGLA